MKASQGWHSINATRQRLPRHPEQYCTSRRADGRGHSPGRTVCPNRSPNDKYKLDKTSSSKVCLRRILYSGFGAFERIGGPVAAAHGRYRGLSPWHEPLRALQNNRMPISPMTVQAPGSPQPEQAHMHRDAPQASPCAAPLVGEGRSFSIRHGGGGGGGGGGAGPAPSGLGGQHEARRATEQEKRAHHHAT